MYKVTKKIVKNQLIIFLSLKYFYQELFFVQKFGSKQNT